MSHNPLIVKVDAYPTDCVAWSVVFFLFPLLVAKQQPCAALSLAMPGGRDPAPWRSPSEFSGIGILLMAAGRAAVRWKAPARRRRGIGGSCVGSSEERNVLQTDRVLLRVGGFHMGSSLQSWRFLAFVLVSCRCQIGFVSWGLHLSILLTSRNNNEQLNVSPCLAL